MLFNLLSAEAALLLALPQLAFAATKKFDFDIGWVRANPDNAFERPVIGINGKWPIPTIEVNIGDRVIIDAHNSLGNQSTSLHFHGLFMNGSTQMDGPAGVSQCPIVPGTTFTYNFTVGSPVSLFLTSNSLSTGRPTWHILVPFAYLCSISRWSAGSLYRPRQRLPIQEQVR